MTAVIDGHQQAKRLRALYASPNEIAPTGQCQGDKGALAKTRVAELEHSRLPLHWRDRTPAPAGFYAKVLPDLSEPDAGGLAVTTCPLHGEVTTVLTVNLSTSRGCWHCPACGKGDMVSFCMRRFNEGFVAAVRRLVLGVQQ